MKKLLNALLLSTLLCVPAVAQVPGLPGFTSFFYKNITGDATTVLKSGPGTLHSITFNTPTATETVKLYDGLTASGTLFATITVPSSPQPVTLTYDVSFGVGLTVVTATATSDITVSFR